MRPAPSLDVVLPSGRRERLGVAAVVALAAAAFIGWLLAWVALQLDMTHDGTVIAAVSIAVAAAAGLMALRRPLQPGRRLRFDGAGWWVESGPAGGETILESASATARAEVAVDLGHWMLLRLTHQGGGQIWLAADAHCAGADWPQLRATLWLYRAAGDASGPTGHP